MWGWGATDTILKEYDIADKAYDMNVLAARLAKRVASDYSTNDKPRWVAGSMGPGRKLPTLGQISFTDLREAYRVQASGLLDGGVDLLIVEALGDAAHDGGRPGAAAILAHELDDVGGLAPGDARDDRIGNPLGRVAARARTGAGRA